MKVQWDWYGWKRSWDKKHTKIIYTLSICFKVWSFHFHATKEYEEE